MVYSWREEEKSPVWLPRLQGRMAADFYKDSSGKDGRGNPNARLLFSGNDCVCVCVDPRH